MPDKKLKYNHTDFDMMWTLIEVDDWEDALKPLDIHHAWDVCASCYESILKECVLYQVPKENIYMTREASCVKKKKCKLWERY